MLGAVLVLAGCYKHNGFNPYLSELQVLRGSQGKKKYLEVFIKFIQNEHVKKLVR